MSDRSWLKQSAGRPPDIECCKHCYADSGRPWHSEPGSEAHPLNQHAFGCAECQPGEPRRYAQ